jgi:hypothetical protein
MVSVDAPYFIYDTCGLRAARPRKPATKAERWAGSAAAVPRSGAAFIYSRPSRSGIGHATGKARPPPQAKISRHEQRFAA